MDIFIKLAKKIIEEQETIIGPVAWEQANKVSGLMANIEEHSVTIEGDKKNTINELVKQYAGLFGQTSIDICRQAVHDLISQLPKDQIPNTFL